LHHHEDDNQVGTAASSQRACDNGGRTRAFTSAD
jgi:hypothetical protein